MHSFDAVQCSSCNMRQKLVKLLFYNLLPGNCYMLHCLPYGTHKQNIGCQASAIHSFKEALHSCSHIVLGFANRCHYPCGPRRSSVRRLVKRPAGIWIAPPHYSVALLRRAAPSPGTRPSPPLSLSPHPSPWNPLGLT